MDSPRKPSNCPDCQVEPGQAHKEGCDVEICSVCGVQYLSCDCSGENHDPQFSRWSGWWPGHLESTALGMDLNEFYISGWAKKLFVKPKV